MKVRLLLRRRVILEHNGRPVAPVLFLWPADEKLPEGYTELEVMPPEPAPQVVRLNVPEPNAGCDHTTGTSFDMEGYRYLTCKSSRDEPDDDIFNFCPDCGAGLAQIQSVKERLLASHPEAEKA